MNAKELFRSKRESVLAKWHEHVLASYPQETSKFLGSKKDPFANPVGKRINQGLSGLLDLVLEGGEQAESKEEAIRFLDDIIRVRAVQEFAPGAAVRFLFELKNILFSECAQEADKLSADVDWREADKRIDALALAGLDAYVRCREKIFEIRVNELRNLSHSAMVRAGLVSEVPGLSEEGEAGIKDREKTPDK